MQLLIRLAWRNIWRNPRRTLITMSSIVLAVALSVIMRSMQFGTYDKMIDDMVGTYAGHVQVHARGYWHDKTIDRSFDVSGSLMQRILSQPGVTGAAPRLESFALAAGAERTRGVFVVGIAAEQENALTGLKRRLVSGSYLAGDEGGALIARGLADFLNLHVGDTLALLGQGFHGASAAGAFPVRGIVEFGAPDLNRGFVYLDLAAAQEMYSTGNRLTSIVLSLRRWKNAEPVAASLGTVIDTSAYEVMTWRELLPELVQQIQGDNAGGVIMLGILYMIVAFGIFGTILMMTSERIREFGVVNAVGLTRASLATMVGVETVFLSVLSAGAGALLSLPVVLYYHAHPIRLTGEAAKGMIGFGIEPVLPFALDPWIFLSQGVIVIGMTLASAMYPWMVLRRLEPVQAMRR